MEQLKNICSILDPIFGRIYESASLETINGVITPVHFTGTDFINLNPKDNTERFAYIRETQPAFMKVIDLGGESPAYDAMYKLRLVIFDPKPFNTFDQLRRFAHATRLLKLEVSNIITNIDQLYKQETGGSKVIAAKGWGYMGIDFTVREFVDSCNVTNC